MWLTALHWHDSIFAACAAHGEEGTAAAAVSFFPKLCPLADIKWDLDESDFTVFRRNGLSLEAPFLPNICILNVIH